MSMRTLEFTEPGPPFANQRHRTAVRGGIAIQYDPPNNKSVKALIQDWAMKAMSNKDVAPFKEGPLSIVITAYFPLPKGLHRKKNPRIAAPYTGKNKDADNIAKIVMDALNGVAYTDDSQVSILQVVRVRCAQGELPRTEVVLRQVTTKGD